MMSYFLKNWHSDPNNEGDNKNNQIFRGIIEPLILIVLSKFRGLDQEY